MKLFNISLLGKLVYLGVIALFIFLYINSNEVNRYNIDDLKITEVSSITQSRLPKRIKDLNLEYKGLTFFISGKHPLGIISDDNVKRTSLPQKIEIGSNSITIFLKNSIELRFKVDSLSDKLLIDSTIPKVFPTIKEIVIPFALLGSYSIEEDDISYKFSNGKDEFHLKLSDRYRIDFEESSINLVSKDDKTPSLTFSQKDNSTLPPVEQWYIQNRESLASDIDKNIEDYLTKAETHIKSIFDPIKFDRANNRWINIPSQRTLTEKAIVSYLGISLNEGEYNTNMEKVKVLNSYYPSLFTFLSSPYMGDIINKGTEGVNSYNRELDTIKKEISASSPELLTKEIEEHYFLRDDMDLKKFEYFINSRDIATLDVRSLAVSLENLLNIAKSERISKDATDTIKAITDQLLLKLYWDQSGLYIGENSISDQALNLKVGQSLIESSVYDLNEYAKAVGEALVRTYLNNSDNDGSLFSTYNIKEKRFSGNIIPVEESYLKLSENNYLPHYIHSNGITIWTISDEVSIKRGNNSVTITESFPWDRESKVNSHYLTIIGIEPYKQLFFRGTLWRADRLFERYGVGYYYDYNTRILFFMPNHSREKESIVINY